MNYYHFDIWVQKPFTKHDTILSASMMQLLVVELCVQKKLDWNNPTH